MKLLLSFLALLSVSSAFGAGQPSTDSTPQTLSSKKMIENERVVTASGPITMSTTDYDVCAKLTTPAAIAINLPATPVTGNSYQIVDCAGNAATYNLTITPAAGLISGASTAVININYGAWTGFYNGTSWETVTSNVASGGGITALTGPVTASGPGSVASTIAAGAVTLANQANLSAYTVQANGTGSAATPQAVSAASFAHAFGNSVSVLTYGAKGDAKQIIPTVSITAGAAALTATGASFVSTDCQSGTGCTGATNKVISIEGAGTHPTMTGVAISGTAGQFTCTCSNVVIGNILNISGTYGGTGSITGYTNPTSYYISATNGTSTFTLKTLLQVAIVTTSGTPSGLTYSIGVNGLVTTIIGFTSSTSITLAANAGTTVTSTSELVAYGTDDTTALQNAINAGSGTSFSNYPQFVVWVPCPYLFTYTTALAIPIGTVIKGCGKLLGSQLMPMGVGAFIINGASYGGGYDENIQLEGLYFDLSNAQATNCAYIKSAYYIHLRDVGFGLNPSTLDPPPCTGAMVDIDTGNDIYLENVTISGNSNVTTSPLGLSIGGASNTTVKMVDVDREYFVTGWQAVGTVTIVDDVAPYIESSTLPYSHNITTGQVSIFGGNYFGGTGAPYLVNILADNLAIYGTNFPAGSYTVSVFNVPATASFHNVRTFGLANGAGASWFASAANLAAVEMPTPNQAYVDRKTIDWYKQLTSAAPTTLVSFKTSGTMNVVVTVYADIDGSGGTGTAAAKYTFSIGGGGVVPNIVVSDQSSAGSANWLIALSAPTLTVSSSVYTFGLTATAYGALGAGSSADVWAKVEYSAYDVSYTDAVRGL